MSKQRSSKSAAIWALLAMLAAPQAHAGTEEEAVLRLERERLDATSRHDAAALDRMTTPNLSYVHASGLRQDKAQYLSYVRAGGATFASYTIQGERVRRFGDVAITHGVFSFTTDTSAGPARAGKTLFTAIYLRSGAAWRLQAWQATRIP